MVGSWSLGRFPSSFVLRYSFDSVLDAVFVAVPAAAEAPPPPTSIDDTATDLAEAEAGAPGVGRGVFEASFSNKLRSSSSIRSRSARWTASRSAPFATPDEGAFLGRTPVLGGGDFKSDIPDRSAGDEKISLKLILAGDCNDDGCGVDVPFLCPRAPCKTGEMQMLPLPVPRFARMWLWPPLPLLFAFGDESPPRGNDATSEKKKDVLTVGVRGVRVSAPLGVLSIDPNPPGENRPFEFGECNHASTLDESNAALPPPTPPPPPTTPPPPPTTTPLLNSKPNSVGVDIIVLSPTRGVRGDLGVNGLRPMAFARASAAASSAWWSDS